MLVSFGATRWDYAYILQPSPGNRRFKLVFKVFRGRSSFTGIVDIECEVYCQKLRVRLVTYVCT